MLYTVGKTDIYEPYIDSDLNAAKAKGGSVWRTRAEAERYCALGFAVYGVAAKWERDVIEDCCWGILKKKAKLFKL